MNPKRIGTTVATVLLGSLLGATVTYAALYKRYEMLVDRDLIRNHIALEQELEKCKKLHDMDATRQGEL